MATFRRLATMRTIPLCTAPLAALAFASSLQAHPTGSMYDTTPVWVTGTVVDFEAINPHTITTLEARGADGEVRRWGIEGPSRSQLDRMDDIGVPQVGDTIAVCAFPYKYAAELSRMFPGVDFSARRASSGADGTSPQFAAGGKPLYSPVPPEGLPWDQISSCRRFNEQCREIALMLAEAAEARR